jgi:hypothetical protein
MKTQNLRNSIGRSPLRRGLLLIALVLACFALSTIAQAKQPTPTPTPTPTPSPTPAGEDRGNGNTAAENVEALISITIGLNNTSTGWQSLYSNTEGNDNTATGFNALYNNTVGNRNTASGSEALFSNTTGFTNTAVGYRALFNTSFGQSNTAIGAEALHGNTGGAHNTAIGDMALSSNTTGAGNTVVGERTLEHNTTGSHNIALGALAGFNVTTANNVISIGSDGADVSNSCFIGNIRSVTTANADAIPVLIDSAGQLGTTSSSRRYKKEIKPMDQTSEAVLGLKPVTFHYKSDKMSTPQFGLIAEEVAEVNPDLVVRDEKGEIYTVRYEAVNAMLLNEFLKAHRRIEDQDKRIDQLTSQLKEQASRIQKVNDKVELNRPAPQTVANDQ